LLYENHKATTLFWRCLTQFRHGFSGPTGLIYSEVEIVAKSLKINFDEELENIQTMENEYLKIVNEQREKDKK